MCIRCRERCRSFNGATAFQPSKGQHPSKLRKLGNTCFNGATAFQPWKGSDFACSSAMSTPSFNGATAFQPWKGCQSPRTGHKIRWLQWGHGISAVERSSASRKRVMMEMASMGPRHFSRGKPTASTAPLLCCCLLQWGHGISAVESAAVTLATVSVAGSLQWGHGISAVERDGGVSVYICLFVASMGPRHFSRGKCKGLRLDRQVVNGLQWGHGISAVERWTGNNPQPETRSRFNGATAFQPWKALDPFRLAGSCQPALQWGHGISAVESPVPPPVVRRQTSCFNGATAFQPWKVCTEPYATVPSS